MEIRACTDADLILLNKRWVTGGNVHETHYRRQQLGDSTYLVAWHDREPPGSGVINWHESDAAITAQFPHAATLLHLQVRDEYRGMGIGTSLVDVAENLAVDRGRTHMVLGVADDNSGASRLYRRLGYEETGIVTVDKYDWVDTKGQTHRARERSRILAKPLVEQS